MSKEARSFAMICALVFSLGTIAFPAAAQETPLGQPGAVLGQSPVAQSGVGTDQGVQLEGELEIIHQDFKDGRGRYLYSLKLSDGTRVPLRFVKEPPTHLLTGDHVRANGRLSNGSLLLYSGSTNLTKSSTPTTTSTSSGDTTGSSTTSSIPVSYTFGAQKTLVILVNFQDDVVQPYTVADVQNVFFGTSNTLNSFILENSYGQTSITGDVVGWYTIPDSVATCSTSQIATDANNAAVAAGVSLSNYTRYVYFFPYASVCPFAGASTVGGNPSQTWIDGTLDIHVLDHELGHAFGLWHSHLLDCGSSATVCSSGTVVEYGDLTDTMGVPQTASADYNAYQKERLGWLNYKASPSIQTITTSGTYTINVYEPTGAGPKALKVLKSTDPTTGAKTWYYIEARQAVGFDAFLSDSTITFNTQNETTGVLFHLGTDGNGNSGDLLDMTPATPTTTGWFDMSLAVGQSFQDSAAGVTFTTTAADSTGATVGITFGPVSAQCTHANPTVSISPSNPSISAGSSANYMVSVASNDSSGCPSSTFNLSSTQPAGWSGTLSATNLTLSPAQSGSATLAVTVPSTATPGTYAVGASATNPANSSLSASATASSTVVAPSISTLSVTLVASGSTFTSGQKVIFTAKVLNGTSTAGGAAVTFTMTKANGSKTTATATASSTGMATWSYRIGNKDPKGTWSAVAQATSSSQTAVSNTATFTVQ